MRTKHARNIRRGIEDRILYNKAFDLGFDKEFLKGFSTMALKGKPQYQVSAYMRTTTRNGKVYTGYKWGQAFINPDMRGHDAY